MIPFDAINAAALASYPRLLHEWFPSGKLRGKEFLVGNLAGTPGESLSINTVTGKWGDFAAGAKGGDPIGLAAAAFHGGDRIAAARALETRLGVSVNDAQPKRAEQKARPKEDWKPIVPPPDGAPRPGDACFSGYDAVYDYRDAEDRLLFYVRRREARGDTRKQFHPLTFGILDGKRGWHAKHPAAPRHLYGLNRLAILPDAPVLICEGEKSANAAQEIFPGYACITWSGGTESVDLADLAPLHGRSVVIWPDADEVGRKAAARLAAKLPCARLLRVDDLPEGHDAADIGVPDDPEEWLANRLCHAPERGSEPELGGSADPTEAEANVGSGLRNFLAIEAWANREMPAPDRLLGDLVTTTTRTFLVGRTGLGKTLFGFGIACGLASGTGFLHWRSARPARVLYLDGEMPPELIKARAIDAMRRSSPPAGNLMIYTRDMEDAFAARFPTLGKMPPLNTEAGQNFILALIDVLGGVDVVIFDNVMSLIAGDQKDEVPWSDTLPLVSALTAKRIGQVWLDHTGHNTDRQYGSSTKAWRFDAVALMTLLSDDQRAPHEVAFTLSFEPPGKARRRTPANWADFETRIIRLADDRWTSEPATAARRADTKLTPQCRQFYRALLDALATAELPGRTTRNIWYAECVRTGLADPIEPDDDWRTKSAKHSKLRKYMTEMKTAGLIGVDGETIHDLRRPAP